MAELDGQRILVTGGAGDIGAAMGIELRRKGAAITLLDRKAPDEAQPWLERAGAEGGVDYAQADVCDRAAVDAVIEAHGPFDTVIANAGIGSGIAFLELTEEEWRRTLDVNLTGAFHTAQSAARAMVAAGKRGRILFTGSWVGEVPWPDISAYSVSKAGVRMLARSMARELATHGIRVNVVAPGIVRAGLAKKQMETEPAYARRVRNVIPLGSLQTPEQVAQATAFLCSPAADYITGTTLLVDGGASLFQFDEGEE